MLEFPNFDPVLVQIGPFAIRWYALAYIAGLVAGWRYMIRMNAGSGATMTRENVDDLLVWMTLGIILGGRLGYVLFYNLDVYLRDPLQILIVWQGGMAFHGGMAGVVVALWLFCRRHGISMLRVGDQLAQVAPIGLGLGRVANFINGELWGRTTDVPWGMVFPTGGPDPRHPSQLYQAVLEGLCLFVLIYVARQKLSDRVGPGFFGGLFLVGYGVARIIGEVFRQPDAHIGFLMGGATMGQLLSIPMIVAGGLFMWWAMKVAAQAPMSQAPMSQASKSKKKKA